MAVASPSLVEGILCDLDTIGWTSSVRPMTTSELAATYGAMDDLFDASLVNREVAINGQVIFVARRYFPRPSRASCFSTSSSLILDRGTALVACESGVMLESVDGGFSVELREHSLIAALVQFWTPHSVEQVHASDTGDIAAALASLIELLARHRVLVDASAPHPPDPSGLQRHEALFYGRTRTKRVISGVTRLVDGGATSIEQPPDAEAGTSFEEIVRRRRSWTTYGRTLKAEELKSLTALVTRQSATADERQRNLPYPTAGGLDSLDLRCLVFDVEGLTAGTYILQRGSFRLDRVPPPPLLHRLASEVRHSVGQRSDWNPQALLLVEGRTSRLAGRYPGLALSLLLREAGACMEFIYLLAAHLHLSVCAVGVVSDHLLNIVDRECPPDVVRLTEIALGGGASRCVAA